MPMIRVLVVSPTLHPALGGIPSFCVRSCLASQRAGVQNTLVYATDKEAEAAATAFREQLIGAGVGIRQFPLLRVGMPRAPQWGISLGLARWILRNAREYDVIHSHSVWGAAAAVSGIAAAMAHRPYVVTPHGSLTLYDIDVNSKSKLRRWEKMLMRRWYTGTADVALMASDLEAHDSRVGIDRLRVRVVGLPVVDDEALQVCRPYGNELAGDFAVGYLGRLHAKKNVQLLIRALELLPNWVRLVVGGSGPAEITARLKALARDRMVSARVEWLGHVEPDNRPSFLRSIDVLAMPSEYESFGAVAGEAMACGVPVVVSTRCGISEVVERRRAGVVSPPEVKPFAEALRCLADDGAALSVYGRQGVKAAREEMSFDAYGQTLLREYKHCLSG
jgi:glycosyltransferase involved in cell wall biosynthesis